MKQVPRVEWPPEWGTPSWSALSFSRSRWPGLALSALIVAAVAAGVTDGVVPWVASFAIGVAGAAAVMWGASKPKILFPTWIAGFLTWNIGKEWVKDPVAAVLPFAIILVLTGVLALVVTWVVGHRSRLPWSRAQTISAKTRVRAALALSPDGLIWGEGKDERVAWGALTSIDPVAVGDRSLDSVTGDYRVIVRSEREVLVDLTDTPYGPAATLFLLKYYKAHPEDRDQLAATWRAESRALRAAHARFSYPKGQPSVAQPSPTQLPA